MRRPRKSEELKEPHKHEGFLLFLCFLSSALIGYILTHYFAIFGA
ncbi:MAG: hypothetical protein ACPLKZ_05605 [Candidatus Bathyarchaeales archaeon]